MSVLFVIVASIFTFGLTSCEELGLNDSVGELEGTTWINDIHGVQLSFTANNKCTFSLVDTYNNYNIIDSVFGTYTANGNNVSITFDDEYDINNATAIINGRTMKFTAPDGVVVTLTKL